MKIQSRKTDKLGRRQYSKSERGSRRFHPGGALMLNITGGLRVFLAVGPADMRKSFNGLYALAVEKQLYSTGQCFREAL
jgi:hypothetical protein